MCIVYFVFVSHHIIGNLHDLSKSVGNTGKTFLYFQAQIYKYARDNTDITHTFCAITHWCSRGMKVHVGPGANHPLLKTTGTVKITDYKFYSW